MQTVSRELEFPTASEDRVMQVNAIPEKGEGNELESILLVSHDITERKRNELELYLTNRKVKESINYAQRIQSSILPDTKTLKRLFTDAFIMFNPRDVVSGDFPWEMRFT